MSSKYYILQRNRQQALIGTPIFCCDKGDGSFMGHKYPFVLKDGRNNLFPPFAEVQKYFDNNQVSWWGGFTPTGHILSSQMACLNHLYPLMRDKDAVLKILNGVRNEFIEVLPIMCDVDPQYIAFEVVSKEDYLNELNTTRGSNCTSVDAFILARHKSSEIWLIPIEWKYTEHYATEDKSAGEKGQTRKNRYDKLIISSDQLKTIEDFRVYYQEPFYQLMRQTLWAEQMLRHKESEIIKAVDYFHIHVIPSANDDLLKVNSRYPYKVSGKGMEETWRGCLTDQSKYQIVDPEILLMPIKQDYPELIEYLKKRYW
ncbi:MAG: hypothetical protein J6R27_04335 [Muribaculaceae bacterium]|nr:hypothetical protein [Muribaculaceae bacterium]